MAKKKQVDRSDEAVNAIRAIFNELTPKERRELETRLFEAPWFATDIKLTILFHAATSAHFQAKDSHRSRKATPENVARDTALMEEKERKSWGQLFMDHPGEDPARLRSAYRRARKRSKAAKPGNGGE
jgi:hypothetical protein